MSIIGNLCRIGAREKGEPSRQNLPAQDLDSETPGAEFIATGGMQPSLLGRLRLLVIAARCNLNVVTRKVGSWDGKKEARNRRLLNDPCSGTHFSRK